VKTIHPLTLALLLVLVLFFPLRILQFVALLYIAVIGLSYLYSRIVRRFVTVRRKDRILRTHRFEPLEIVLILENRSFLPAAYLNVVDQQNNFFATEPGNFIVKLGAGERKNLSYSIESQHRGQYTVGPALIQGSDPLGFFPFRIQASETQTLIVYPEVLPNLCFHTSFDAGHLSASGFMSRPTFDLCADVAAAVSCYASRKRALFTAYTPSTLTGSWLEQRGLAARDLWHFNSV